MSAGGPLAGLKVLDFSRVLAGPFCTMLLGDLGATIYKIEKPGKNPRIANPKIQGLGDDTRAWQPPAIKGESCYFLSINRNKKSVCVDGKTENGNRILRQLAQKCDIVVENFKPGAMARLKVYGSLAHLHK